MTTGHVPQCCISTLLEHLQGQWLHPLPGQLCQCISTLPEKKIFLLSNLDLPWYNIRPLALYLNMCITEAR